VPPPGPEMSSSLPPDLEAAQAIPKQSGNPNERDLSGQPVVIRAEEVGKTFRIPDHRIDSLKERAVHPFRKSEYRELKALDGVSFEVRKGEFFGIAGRNGSGKSTLLKILASIYLKDRGSLKVAGRLGPFIELGVGFNPDLNAQQNIVLNGVMMGLSRQQAESRIDAILEFAELTEFSELKLKNFSSGMMVRLAFSTMLEADVDVLLIDEVLAVGDAAFVQKCNDAFVDMRNAGKTVVLVTHDMDSIERLCDRAMLLQDGQVQMIGDPAEVGREYMKLNFEEAAVEHDATLPDTQRAARMTGAWLEDMEGKRTINVAEGEPVRALVELEVKNDVEGPLFAGVFTNPDGLHVVGFQTNLRIDGEEVEVLEAGQRVTFSTEFENVLRPDRYNVSFRLCRNRNPGDVAMQMVGAIDFVVYGTGTQLGVVEIEMKHDATVNNEAGR
jgi:ABC-2 type transport system ATP-binding protein